MKLFHNFFILLALLLAAPLYTMQKVHRAKSKKRAQVQSALQEQKKVAAEQADNCGICQEKLGHREGIGNTGILTVPPCKHQFCTICLAPWLATANTCPLCRGIIPAGYIKRIGAVDVQPQQQQAMEAELRHLRMNEGLYRSLTYYSVASMFVLTCVSAHLYFGK